MKPLTSRLRGLILALALPGLSGCADLPELPKSTCGNGVIDPATEDCDGHGVGASDEVLCPAETGSVRCHCGEPGTASACRFDAPPVDPATPPERQITYQCPAGWGQGLDAICRQPTGEFRPLGTPLESGTIRTLVADFDGDGRDEVVSLGVADLLGNRTVGVHYLETTGTLRRTESIPSQLATPAASLLSSTTRSDLLFGFHGGVGVLAGQSDQSLAPLAFPTLTIPDAGGQSRAKIFPVRFLDAPLLHQILVLTSNASTSVLLRDNRSAPEVMGGCDPNDQQTPHGALVKNFNKVNGVQQNSLPAETVDTLVAHAAGGLLDGPTGALCDRVALGFAGQDHVLIVSPCRKELKQGAIEWNAKDPAVQKDPPDPEPEEAISVALPFKLPSDTSQPVGIFFVDVDRDGRVDLMVGSPQDTSVAYGLADGSFSSKPGAAMGDNTASLMTRLNLCLSVPESLGAAGQGGAGQGGAGQGGAGMGGAGMGGAGMAGMAGGGEGGTDGQGGAGGAGPGGMGGGADVGMGGMGTGSMMVECCFDPAQADKQLPCSFSSPLAVADLNGDGVIDYVTNHQILVSEWLTVGQTPTLVYRARYDKRGGNWLEAVVADFTGDGAPDVVVSQYTPTLELFVSADQGTYFNRSTIPTSAQATRLTAGDLDGDQVADLAFQIAGVHNDSPVDDAGVSRTSVPLGDSVWVSFGQFNRPPTSPVSLGRLGRISQITIAPLADRTTVGTDSIGDLGVGSLPEDPTLARFSVLYGDSSRQLLAPIGLSNFQCNLRATSAGLVVGQFTGDQRLDVAVLGLDPDMLVLPGEQGATGDEGARMWMFAGQEQGSLTSPTVLFATDKTKGLQFGSVDKLASGGAGGGMSGSGGMQAGAAEKLGVHVGALIAAGDLENDGLDEVVVVAPVGSEFFSKSQVLVWKSQPGDSGSYVLTPTDDFSISLPVIGVSQLELLDIDGDGFKDLLLLSTGVGSGSSLVVFWNDGQGKLSESPVEIPVQPGGSSPQAFALLNARGKTRQDLLVISDAGAALLTLGGGHQVVPTVDKNFAGSATVSGSSVAVGDLTGDGIDDLVVTRDAGFQVLEGIARLK